MIAVTEGDRDRSSSAERNSPPASDSRRISLPSRNTGVVTRGSRNCANWLWYHVKLTMPCEQVRLDGALGRLGAYSQPIDVDNTPTGTVEPGSE
jgi:hypothetical protein